jgi:hypothetical protein
MKMNITCKTELIIFGLICCLLPGCSNSKKENNSEKGFVQIFDGQSLDGWKGDPTYWSVENGNLVGIVTPETILKRNSFIIWQGGQPENFELKLDYRVSKSGNSGINYRSEEIEGVPFALRGYQCDIDGANKYTGQNYEEQKRRTLAYHGQKVLLETLPDSLDKYPISKFTIKNAWTKAIVLDTLGDLNEMNANIKSEDWNSVHIIAKNNRLQHFVNGVLLSDVTDNDVKNRSQKGLIGVQVHVGPPMKIEYNDIRIKEL